MKIVLEGPLFHFHAMQHLLEAWADEHKSVTAGDVQIRLKVFREMAAEIRRQALEQNDKNAAN